MKFIEIHGEITELIEHYEPAEWEAWKKGVRTGFPLDPRLAHYVYQQPRYYFGETHYVRKLLSQGFICWQERYQLFKAVEHTSPYFLYSEEIASLMERQNVIQLRNLQSRVKFSLVNPDIVAFHPEMKSWAFFEVKMPNDRIRSNQVCSLLALQHILDAQVGVIRYVPSGEAKAKLARTYRDTFRLKGPTIASTGRR